MTHEGSRAVFLSYASQDAEAARHIAESLRSGGLEVWFDVEGGLEHGDEWDAKIRRQIKECVLFIPLISANTQARLEGYFRIEWDLAAERARGIASGVPFILPVIIDDTREPDALVPDRFRMVQWTRLLGGDMPPEVLQRFLKLWSHRTGAVAHETVEGASLSSRQSLAESDDDAHGRRQGAPLKGKTRRWLIPIIVVILAIAGISIWAPWKSGTQRSAGPPTSIAPVSEARKLANRAMKLLEDPNFTRETSWLADELCQRALALDAGDAEVWAVASFASNNLYWNTYDTSAERREKARSQAARASQLDPQSVRAALAVALCLGTADTGKNGEMLQALWELHRRAPDDQLVIFYLVRTNRRPDNDAAVEDLLRKLRALPRTDLLPLTLWFRELRLRQQGRFAEAEVILDEMLAGPEVLRGAYYEKLQILMRSGRDLTEAGAFIEEIPARFQQEPSFGSAIAYYWLWRAEPEKALQALARVPQDYFEEYAAREPKGYLTGWAHAMAGRAVAAQAEWRSALALVEERLKTDGRNFGLLDQHALLLALTGQQEAARAAWQLRAELGGTQDRPAFTSEAQVFLALNEPESAIAAIERGAADLSPGEWAQVLPELRYHPAYAPIRDDPRVQRILAEGAAVLRKLNAQPTDADTAAVPAPVDNKSVAVLAFTNLSDDKDNEYFSDGISEELLNVLAQIPELKVSARTSSFHFKGKDTPIPEIARQLGVAYVVEGSVRRAGDRVRITAQLIKASDGFHVWSDSFTRELKDIFAVQDEIAGLIAGQLQLKLGSASAPRQSVNPEAYRLVLEGHHFWLQRTDEDLARAEDLFQQALALDPNFAQAHAGLASVLMTRDWYRQLDGSPSVPTDARRARSEVDRAMSLDPSLAEPHAILGVLFFLEGKHAESEQAFQTALRLNTNYSFGHHWHSHLLMANAELEAALAEMNRAVQIDPLSFVTLLVDSTWHIYAGRYEEALALSDRAREFAPDMFVPLLANRSLILLQLDRREEAVTLARQVASDVTLQPRWGSDANSIYVLRQAGFEREATDYAERLLATLPADSSLHSFVLVALGRRDEALEQLARQGVPPSSNLHSLLYSPIWNEVRDDPRFLKIIAEQGLAETYQAARASRARLLAEPEAEARP